MNEFQLLAIQFQNEFVNSSSVFIIIVYDCANDHDVFLITLGNKEN